MARRERETVGFSGKKWTTMAMEEMTGSRMPIAVADFFAVLHWLIPGRQMSENEIF